MRRRIKTQTQAFTLSPALAQAIAQVSSETGLSKSGLVELCLYDPFVKKQEELIKSIGAAFEAMNKGVACDIGELS